MLIIFIHVIMLIVNRAGILKSNNAAVKPLEAILNINDTNE